jgi:hypothetical protein
MQNFDHNIGFREKRQFFRRKLAKIAENCDNNIDPGRPVVGSIPPPTYSFPRPNRPFDNLPCLTAQKREVR